MRAIPIVKAIAKSYESNLVALHVRGPIVNPMTPPAAWPMVLEAEKQKDEQCRRELLAHFGGVPAEARIEDGDIVSHLEAATKSSSRRRI
jgi:hypothetical protein